LLIFIIDLDETIAEIQPTPSAVVRGIIRKNINGNTKRATANNTLMVFAMIGMFAAGYTPYTLVTIFKHFTDTNSNWYKSLYLVAYFFLLISHSSNIIIYYNFNKLYRNFVFKIFYLNQT
jgi:hypothetical protein